MAVNDIQNQKDFKVMQSLRNVRLLKPLKERDMYYAAYRNDQLELTDLGKFYWRMIKKGKL